jgi:hypothetical protein
MPLCRSNLIPYTIPERKTLKDLQITQPLLALGESRLPFYEIPDMLLNMMSKNLICLVFLVV